MIARTMMDGAVEVAHRTHRFTVADFLRMDQSGLFDSEARVELLEGEIIDMAPIGSPHAAIVAFLHRRLIECLRDRATVWGQSPVMLGDFTAPQPDISIMRPRRDHYRRDHPRPADILLLIEVADTTLAFDREKKMPLYASAGIPELWIVDVGRSAFHVFRGPAQGGYGSEQILIAPENIGIAAFPEIAIDLSGFFTE